MFKLKKKKINKIDEKNNSININKYHNNKMKQIK